MPDNTSGPELLQEKAYRLVRQAICEGQFTPGMALSESQVASTFQLTKTPVRSALSRLEHEGWLLSSARRGYEVRPITLRDTRDIFGLRKVVEPQATFMAAGNMSVEKLQLLDEACVASYQHGASVYSDNELFFKANKAFHVGIAQATGNRRLVQIIDSLHDECERILHFGMKHLDWSIEWRHGHEAIVEALGRGDGKAAKEIAYQQLVTSEKIVVDALLKGFADIPIALAT